MLARKILSQKVLQQVSTYPFWSDVREMALGFSTKAYLVGGKVYRTVMEIEHGNPANPIEADFDFLLIGTSNQNRQFDGWRQLRGPGTPTKDPGINLNKAASSIQIKMAKIPKEQQLSRTYERDVAGTYSKVDLVSLEDVQKLTGDTGKLDINMYFRSVPLDIQAIALRSMALIS